MKQTKEQFIETIKDEISFEEGALVSDFDTWEQLEDLLTRFEQVIREEV